MGAGKCGPPAARLLEECQVLSALIAVERAMRRGWMRVGIGIQSQGKREVHDVSLLIRGSAPFLECPALHICPLWLAKLCCL